MSRSDEGLPNEPERGLTTGCTDKKGDDPPCQFSSDGANGEGDDQPLHLLEELHLEANTQTIARVQVSTDFEGKTLLLKGQELRQKTVSANVVATVKEGHMLINIINLNNEDIVLQQGTKVGEVGECEEYKEETGQT